MFPVLFIYSVKYIVIQREGLIYLFTRVIYYKLLSYFKNMLYGTLGMYFMTATVSKNVDYILRLADEM